MNTRKLTLGLVLLSLILWIGGPVQATEQAPGASAQDESPATPATLQQPTDDPSQRLDLSCSASTTCPCGNQISCTGSWDCFARNGQYIECDGNRTNCSSGHCNAELWCPSGQLISCTGTCNSCGNDSSTIWCNGNYYTCDDCPFPNFECSF